MTQSTEKLASKMLSPSSFKEFKEGKGVTDSIEELQKMISEKQTLLNTLCGKMGENKDKFRTVRKMLDSMIKAGADVQPLENYCIQLQSNNELWHNNLLMDEEGKNTNQSNTNLALY